MPRIEFYLQSMLPCICINYARRYTCAIFDEITLHHKKLALSILKSVASLEGKDEHTKFAYFMFHPDLAISRIAVVGSLGNNPLLQNRLWKLYENFHSPSELERSMASHEERVKWQISRIYRARNSLVHGGQKPRYISPLTLNGFEYFKTTFFTLLGRAEKVERKVDTEYLISSILFDYESMKSRMNRMKREQSKGFDLNEFLDFFEKS